MEDSQPQPPSCAKCGRAKTKKREGGNWSCTPCRSSIGRTSKTPPAATVPPRLFWASEALCRALIAALDHPGTRRAGRFALVRDRHAREAGQPIERYITRLFFTGAGTPIPGFAAADGEAVEIPGEDIALVAQLNPRRRWSQRPSPAATQEAPHA